MAMYMYSYPTHSHTPINPFDSEVRVRVHAASRGVAQGANTPDYARILELCDMINRDGSGRAAAVTAQTLYTIMKEESNYLILFITLHVLELCVMNCGSVFHDRIAYEQFVKALIHLGGKYLKKKEHFRIEDANSAKGGDQISGNHKALKFSVRMKAMSLVQSLALGFQKDARHVIFYTEYQKLVAKGIVFPVHKPTDYAPIATPAPHRGAPGAPVSHSSPVSAPRSQAPPTPLSKAQNPVQNFAVIRTNVTLLNDMLRNNDDIRGNDLVQELVSGTRTVKDQMQTWIAANLDDANLGTALELNDFIEATLKLYQQRQSGGSGGPAVRIHEEGKARNFLGSPSDDFGGGRARSDSSSSDDSSSDDFRLISNRHGAPAPVLQPISTSTPPPSAQLHTQLVPPPYHPYQPPPGAVLSTVPPPQMPPNLPAPPPGYAWIFPPYNPNAPQPQQPMLVPYPYPLANPGLPPGAPPTSLPTTPPSGSPGPVAQSSPAPMRDPGSPFSPVHVPPAQSQAPAFSAPPANNPFTSPRVPHVGVAAQPAPAAGSAPPPSDNGAPAPIPGAAPVYVLWPQLSAPATSPPAVYSPPPAPHNASLPAGAQATNPFETR